MFDDWSTLQNQAVIGFIVSTLDDNLVLHSRCIANFPMKNGHGAEDMCKLISKAIFHRLGNGIPDFFVSDSGPANKAAVR